MKAVEKINLIEEEISKLKKWKRYYNGFFKEERFVAKKEFDASFPESFNVFKGINIKLYKLNREYKKLYNEYYELNDNLIGKMREHNNALYSKRIKEFNEVSPTVEGKNLDTQQLRAIVRDDHNQLVIAGAGSGKTTTIVGKIKYLLNVKNIKPEEILLLSFTNVAADDMSKRILSETGYDFNVYTFHKLGFDIIRESSNINYQVFHGSFYKLIKEHFEELLTHEEYLNNFLYYLERGRLRLRDEFSFTNEEEYLSYLDINPPTTLKNEVVKSYGELEIANFLFRNGIEYVYEDRYKILVSDNNHKEYKPDFYLPDYDIYIEYYGIDKNNNVPSYFKGRDRADAKTVYLEGIEWKRELHKNNNTTLVESYYYEKKSGKLLHKLKKNLTKLGVEFRELTDKELWNKVQEYQKYFVNDIIDSFETIISLIKSNDYTIDEVKKLCEKSSDKLGDLSLVSLVEPLYNYYNEVLIREESIDFNDMINSARKYVASGKYHHNYKYVIVDEYQDISKARYRLLKALRDEKDFNLFCVGDDWQSIYRFTGSDVSYITDFSTFWGDTHISKIEHTYRFSNQMALISGEFIMKNNKQIKKKMVGLPSKKFPIGVASNDKKYKLTSILRHRLEHLPENSTILFIGRYEHDFDFIIKEDMIFKTKYDYVNNIYKITYVFRKDLNIIGLTAHKSKGLEADYVFILNNKNGVNGFPSKIQDLPIINLLLEKGDNYPFSEERRLFYVALTRSKKKTYLLVVDGRRSLFVKEIEGKYAKEIKDERYEWPRDNCDGKIVKRSGPNGPFYGCTNYKADGTGCNYTRTRF